MSNSGTFANTVDLTPYRLGLGDEERNMYGRVFSAVSKRMIWSDGRIHQWMETKNPAFNYETPVDMVKAGKGNRVLQWISSLSDY